MTEPEANHIEARLSELSMEMSKMQQRTGAQRVWDVLFRIMVPMGFITAGVIVQHEVRLTALEQKVETLPPKWLSEALKSMDAQIKRNGDDMREEFRELKVRVRSLEQRVK